MCFFCASHSLWEKGYDADFWLSCSFLAQSNGEFVGTVGDDSPHLEFLNKEDLFKNLPHRTIFDASAKQ